MLGLVSYNPPHNYSSDDPFGTRFRSMIMKAIEEREKIPINELPYDDQRRAMARVNEDHANGLPFSYIDLASVLGDPNAGITLTNDPEELSKYFDESIEISRKRDKDLKASRDLRVGERRKKYQEAGIALFVH